jgi:hypothetical protein
MSRVLALAIVIGLASFVGYSVGNGAVAGPRMSEIKVFRAISAYSGDDQVSATVDGVTYGVSREVLWVDESGRWHEGGWPACVPPRKQLQITFGGAVVFGPTSAGSYRILWVDCRK